MSLYLGPTPIWDELISKSLNRCTKTLFFWMRLLLHFVDENILWWGQPSTHYKWSILGTCMYMTVVPYYLADHNTSLFYIRVYKHIKIYTYIHTSVYKCIYAVSCRGWGRQQGELWKTSIKSKDWSAFYYHYVQAILNNVSGKILLKIIFQWSRYKIITTSTADY